MREEIGKRIESARAVAPFVSIADVVQRCGLRNDEAQTLAHLGAFAAFGPTRREALWQVAAIPREPLFQGKKISPPRRGDAEGERAEDKLPSPVPLPARERVRVRAEDVTGSSASPRLCGEESLLSEMTSLERSLADYKTTGLTVGPHIIKHLRAQLQQGKVLRAADLAGARNGQWVKVAGLVIVRQRPGTAKGMCFITIEDETGTANAAVMPQVFQHYRSLIHTAAMLIIEGPLQKTGAWDSGLGTGGKKNLSPQPQVPSPNEAGPPVIHILARRLTELQLPEQPITLTGSGYRMRVSPSDPNNQHPNNEQPSSPATPFPKSHDFR